MSVNNKKNTSSNHYNKKCKCGCGENITIKSYHKNYGIPDYIQGHYHPEWTKKSRENMSESIKNVWKNRSEKDKNKIRDKLIKPKTEIKERCPICNVIYITYKECYRKTCGSKECKYKLIANSFKGKSFEQRYDKRTANYIRKKQGKYLKNKTYKEVFGENKTEKIIQKHLKTKGLERKKIYENFTFTVKRRIKKRDKYKCQNCGYIGSQNNPYICVHHIDYSKDNPNYSDMITLCMGCHRMIHSSNNLSYWKNRLMEIQKERGII
jgi:hypothetical protein